MSDIITEARVLLAMAPERWLALTQASEALLTRAPKLGEWSALDCLGHLVDTEQIFPVRVTAILAGQAFPAFDPDAEGSKTTGVNPRELAARFAQMRPASLRVLESVHAGDLTKTGVHATLGVVTLSQQLHEWVAHDLNHLVQAEVALMQPYIAESGPWQGQFAAHAVKPEA
jgi:hypothetical protein